MKTKSKGRKPKTKTTGKRQTLVAFLLDRSGSMESCRAETVSGFNGYIDGLDPKLNLRFCLTQFDTQGIDLVHDGVPIKEVNRLTDETYRPRGGTPLYDAIGKTVREMEGKSKGMNVLFVTLTDGEENSSREWNENTIRDLIKQKEKDGWTFAHIGVGIDGFAATQRYSTGTQSASNVLRSDVGDSKGRFRSMSVATAAYCCVAGNPGPMGPDGQPGEIGPVNKLWQRKEDGEEA